VDDQVTNLLPKVAEPDVVVWLPGPPRGKGAPRASVLAANPAKGRFQARAIAFQDGETRSYEAQIKYMGQIAMREALLDAPMEGMLRCRVTAVFAVPKSMSKRDKAHALAGYIRPTTKPDDDNLLKCRDALKGVVFRDDSLFVESVVRKFYGENPGWQFECWKWSGLML
jgi:Holliday junction resolvase RusA-like endonuclease